MTDNKNLQRRDFLRRSTAFGVAAAGAALGPWSQPAFASMAPAAALAGSPSEGASPELNFRGPGFFEIPVSPQQTKSVEIPFALVGRNLSGTYNLSLTAPDSVPVGLDISMSMSPTYADFSGEEETFHPVTVTWSVKASGAAPAAPVRLSYRLSATPADGDTTPIDGGTVATIQIKAAQKR